MDGGHYQELGAAGELQHLLHHVFRGVLLHLLPADGRVGVADAGIEQSQVLVNLCRSANRAAWVAGNDLLLDGDGGRYAPDEVALRLVHAPQELAGIATEALDIAPLPFGIEGVEGQRRLTGATDSGNHHKLVPRNAHVNILQVVDARTFYLNVFVQLSIVNYQLSIINSYRMVFTASSMPTC